MRKWDPEVCFAASFAGAAWLIALYSRDLVAIAASRPLGEPRVAHVANFPWNPLNPNTDFFTSASTLGPALAVALAAAALVEIAKSLVVGRWSRKPYFLGTYLLLLASQALVAWDALSRGAWDWAAHFNSLLFGWGPDKAPLGILGHTSGLPWLSLVPLGTFVVVALIKRHRTLNHWPFFLLPALLILSLGLPWLTPRILNDHQSASPLWPWLVAALIAAFLIDKIARLWQPMTTSKNEPQEANRRIPILLLCGAWLTILLAPWIRDLWLPPGPHWPNLGNVAAAPWSEQAEPRSTSIAILGALAIALIAAALVEPVKLMQAGSGYGRLVLFQTIVIGDAVVTSAPDWASYFLSQALPGSPMVDPALLPSWPWPSLIALLALLIMGPRREASPSSDFSLTD